MPLPSGTTPHLGPVIDTSGALLTASAALRDAGAVSLRGGKIQRVNTAGNGWEEVPGHVIGAAEPSTGLFEGMLWYDTTNEEYQVYDGSDFVDIAAGFTLHTGNGAPAASLGDSGDWYLRTHNGQWYQKVNTTWHGRFTPPALSDVDPLAFSTSPDAGTGLASSREDHIHVGLVLGDLSPEDVGTTASAGTSPMASRQDHVHIGDGTGGGGGGVSLSDDAPEDVGTASAGTGTEASRDDHVHGGSAGGGVSLSDDDPEPTGTAAAEGTGTEASRSDHVHIGDGPALSDDDPEDTGTAADPGTGMPRPAAATIITI